MSISSIGAEVKHAQTLSPLAGFAVTLSAALVLFVLAGLFFRFSELPARAYRAAVGREESSEWPMHFAKYYGTIFIIACGIGILVLAIKEAIKI
jgi:hypothetical protein